MKTEKVNECLANYREYSARCAFLEKDIVELERWIEQMRSQFVEDNVRVTAQLSDMPHGGGTTNPVEDLAMKAADGYTPDYIRAAEEDLEARKQELREKQPTVVFVDSWLMCLNPREKMIVRYQVLEGMFWRDMITVFRKEYGEEYTRQGLKRIRDKALEKIYAIAK